MGISVAGMLLCWSYSWTMTSFWPSVSQAVMAQPEALDAEGGGLELGSVGVE